MRAVILAGGAGTRLRPYTTVIPKPLVPIGDRPILEHILHGLQAAGVDRVDLCVSHLAALIESYLRRVDLPGIDLAYHYESEPLGTAGALRLVDDLDGTFIAMNGDILTDLDYRALIAYHHQREAALTIAMHCKRVPIDLGVIHSADGFVSGYTEKPKLDVNVSMGIYVYDSRVLPYIEPGERLQFPDLVKRLLDAGERVAGFPTDAMWFDIGTIAEYERAADYVESRPEVLQPRAHRNNGDSQNGEMVVLPG